MMPAILYGSEAWCLKECEMEVLRRTERYTVKAMCGVHIKGRKRAKDLMLIFGLNDTTGHLAITNCLCWCCHVLRREDDHVLRMALVKGRNVG